MVEVATALLRWRRSDMTRCKAGRVASNGDGSAVCCCGCCGRAKEEAESEMRARG